MHVYKNLRLQSTLTLKEMCIRFSVYLVGHDNDIYNFTFFRKMINCRIVLNYLPGSRGRGGDGRTAPAVGRC